MRTKAGTWALNAAEARQIEAAADADERWVASLEGKDQWLQRPLQPPGLLRSGEHSYTVVPSFPCCVTLGKDRWLQRPLQPPGLLRSTLTTPASVQRFCNGTWTAAGQHTAPAAAVRPAGPECT